MELLLVDPLVEPFAAVNLPEQRQCFLVVGRNSVGGSVLNCVVLLLVQRLLAVRDRLVRQVLEETQHNLFPRSSDSLVGQTLPHLTSVLPVELLVFGGPVSNEWLLLLAFFCLSLHSLVLLGESGDSSQKRVGHAAFGEHVVGAGRTLATLAVPLVWPC